MTDKRIWCTEETRTGRREPKNSETNISQCHFTHQKFHMKWAGLNMRLCG